MTWLWERLMGRVGLLRAISTAVLVDSLLPGAPSPSSPPRIRVSRRRVVAPRLRLVSWWSVWMAISVRPDSYLGGGRFVICISYYKI